MGVAVISSGANRLIHGLNCQRRLRGRSGAASATSRGEFQPELRTILRGVNFTKCNLQGANFQGALLDGADFTGADLSGANFEAASLRNATLRNVNVTGTRFFYSNLRVVPARHDSQPIEDLLDAVCRSSKRLCNLAEVVAAYCAAVLRR